MQVAGHRVSCLHGMAATGGRVSNAYPTFPPPRNSPPKGGLMPYAVRSGHRSRTKAFLRCGMGVRPISLTAGRRPTVATIGRGPEREAPHTGTETRPRLLQEAAVRNIGQWAEA